MASSQNKEQLPEAGLDSKKISLIKVSGGRVVRWLVGSVLFSAVPILISIFFLPKNFPYSAELSHGDFAVLAAALTSASITELIGPDEPGRVIRSVLILACISVLLVTTVLLCGIAGGASRLSPSLDVEYSWGVFFVSLVVGAASWAATIHVEAANPEVDK